MMQKYQHLFDTSHLQSDLKKRSLRGGAVTLTTQAISFVIHLGSTMVLARILTPEDYGMMAMVVAITGLAGILINLGLSTATIQRPEINQEQISTLFWINAGIGAFLMLFVACFSPAIAWFYKTPELAWVAAALSCNFFINGLAVQHQALLNRQMRFIAIAFIQVGATLTGITVAIIAGLHGYGYWALVLNSVTISIFTVIGAWLASGWIPGLPQRNVGVGGMVRFGSDIVGFNIINYFARNLDNILIGRYHGSSALGLYSKAYQLLMMPITNLRDPLNKVAMPALSRLQNDTEQYRNYYMKFSSILAFVSMPVIVFMYVYAENIIGVVLGPKWIGTVELFKILSFAGLIQCIGSTRGVILLSTGKSRRYLYWGAINAFFTILSFLIGLPWGPRGVAMSYAIANYLLFYPSLYYTFKGTPIRIKDFFIAIYKPFLSSIFMGLICFFLLINLKILSDILILSLCFPISIVVYLAATIIVSGGTKEIREYFSYGLLVFTKQNK